VKPFDVWLLAATGAHFALRSARLGVFLPSPCLPPYPPSVCVLWGLWRSLPGFCRSLSG